MDIPNLKEKFARIGARLRTRSSAERRAEMIRRARGGRVIAAPAGPIIDIGTDRRGEYFELTLDDRHADEVDIVDLDRGDRHLVLLVRLASSHFAGAVRPRTDPPKRKFLCGHDERSWFVAAIPEDTSVSSVRTAKEALKPPAVRLAQERAGVRDRDRNRRRNAAFLRQGEWFFLPCPWLRVDPLQIRRNEPLARTGGKPHRAEEAYRDGGETVYVSAVAPSGLTEAEFRAWIASHDRASGLRWTVQQRNASVFVRGRVAHADHATVVLDGWHEVLMNTEHRAAAMRHVAFID